MYNIVPNIFDILNLGADKRREREATAAHSLVRECRLINASRISFPFCCVAGATLTIPVFFLVFYFVVGLFVSKQRGQLRIENKRYV